MIRLPNGKITIACGPDGRPAGVLDVPRGRQCGCSCPECGQPVVARVGPKRAGHFSHAPQSSACTGMGAWHRIVRDLICEMPRIDFGACPPVRRLAGIQRVLRAVPEVPLLDGQYRADAVMELQAGAKIAVEVVDAHDVPPLKLAALVQEGWLVLRIDVNVLRATLDPRLLTDHLAKKVGCAGPWQSWPQFEAMCEQPELQLTNLPWWARVLREFAQPSYRDL